MNNKRLAKKLIAAVGICALMLGSVLHAGWACTGIQLRNSDGSVVSGRTLEFGVYIFPSPST